MTEVFAVENFCLKILTLSGVWYNIILILYLDRMRGDVWNTRKTNKKIA
jgi:hypothetical protein